MPVIPGPVAGAEPWRFDGVRPAGTLPEQTTVEAAAPSATVADPNAPSSANAAAASAPRPAPGPGPDLEALAERTTNDRAAELARSLPVGAEIVELRTQLSKTFVVDGSGGVRVEVYAEPVHFQDPASGQWEETAVGLVAKEDGSGWHNKAAAFDVEFAATTAPRDALARLTLDADHTVSLAVPEVRRSVQARPVPPGHEPDRLGPDDPDLVGSAQATVELPQAVPDGDLVFTSTTTGFKTSLVLTAPSGRSTFVYELGLDGLEASLASDGSVVLRDDAGVTRAVVEVPFVFDSAAQPATSTGTMRLETAGRGRVRLVVDVDVDWLRDPARVYPVVVDPSVNAFPTILADTFVRDTYLSPSGSETSPLLTAGLDNSTNRPTRAYMKWNLTPWGGYDITGADVGLAPDPVLGPAVVGCQRGFQFDRVTSDWDQTTLHWGNQPTVAPFAVNVPSSGTCTPLAPAIDPKLIFFEKPEELTAFAAFIEEWTAGRVPNYGLSVRSPDESTDTMLRFGSKEHSQSVRRPVLYFSANTNASPTVSNLSPPDNAVTGFTPTISARYDDVDGTTGTIRFYMYEWTGTSIGPFIGESPTMTIAPGQTGQWAIAPGLLEPNKGYRYFVDARDEHGANVGLPTARFFTTGPVTVAHSVSGGTPEQLKVGEVATVTVTVTNPVPESTPVTVNHTVGTGLVAILGTAKLNGNDCGAACVLTPSSLTATGTAPANGTIQFSYQALVVAADLLCTARSIDFTVTSGKGWVVAPASGAFPVTACGEGLGLESWWSYVTRTLGPAATAQVNVANGNLVVSHTDAPPVQGRGRLAYVVRRTYNSQAPATLLPMGQGGLGDGWSLNVTTAGEMGGVFSPTGLQISTATLDELLRPGVAMVDRDGTRHTFTPDQTSLNVNLSGPLAWLLDALNLSQGSLVDTLVQIVNQVAGGNLNPGGLALCVDTTYKAPPGVHLSLWRFIAVQAGAPCAGAAGNSAAVVLGYATMRPDRVRQVFSVTGQLLSMFDPAGNELRYRYDLQGRLTRVWEAGVCPEPDQAPTCRALRLSYPTSTQAVVADPAGRTTTYQRTGTKLTSVTTTNAAGTTVEAWHYTYDGAGDSCGGVPGALCSVTAPSGRTSRFTHGASTNGPRVASIAERFNAADPNSPTQAQLTTSIAYSTAPVSASTTVTRGDRAVRYDAIDRFGRAGKMAEATPAQLANNQALRNSIYTWDRPEAPGEPAISCQPVDNRFNHNLCTTVRQQGVIDGSPAPPGWSAAGDQRTEATYTPEGYSLRSRTQLGGAWLTTTYGYLNAYTKPDGTVVQAPDNVTGDGTHTLTPRPSGALFVVTDQNVTRDPRANTSGAILDRNPSERPGTPKAGQCGAGNTGLVCVQFLPEGAVSSYQYDGFGQRTELRTPKIVAAGASAQPFRYVYYDTATTDLSGATSAAGWLRTVIDPTGNFVAFGHDRGGNVFRTWDRDATTGQASSAFPGTLATPPPKFTEARYGPNGSTAAVAVANPWRYGTASVDQLGNLTTITVDAHGNSTAIRPPRGNVAGTDRYDTLQSYDARDELTSVALPATRSTPTKFTYDESGNQTSVTDARGQVRAVIHDAVNRAVQSRYTRGAWADRSPSEAAHCAQSTAAEAPIPAGRILCFATVAYDGLDLVVASADPDGAIAWSRFDQAGRTTATFIPIAAGQWVKAEQTFDNNGNVVDACSPRQATEEPSVPCGTNAHFAAHYTYDGLNRPRTTTTYRQAIDLNTGVRTGGWDTITSSVDYDVDSNPIKATDPRGVVSNTTFDFQNRAQQSTVVRDATTTVSRQWRYSASGDITAIVEGAAGQPATRITSYGYDAAHRSVDTVDAATAETAATDDTLKATEGATPVNLRTRRLYDADGNVVGVYGPRAFVGSVTDPDERWLTRLDLDENGRTTATWAPFYDTTLHKVGNGLITTQCPATSASYQPQPVVGTTIAGWPSTVGVCVSRTTYDAASNVLTQTNPTANGPGLSGRFTSYTYTDDNLAAKVIVPNPAYPQAGEAARVDAVKYQYDASGRTTSQVDVMQWTAETSYTADGLPLTQVQHAPGLAPHSSSTSTYDAAGQVVRVDTLIEADRTDFSTTTYNADGTTYESSTAVTGANAGPVTYRYGYDAAGNPTRTWSPSAVVGAANNTAGVPSINAFTPDGLLASIIEPVSADGSLRRASTFGYDPLGRTTSATNNEITAADLAAVVRGGGTRSSTWSASGLPVSEIGRNGERIDYSHFADGGLFLANDGTSKVVYAVNPYLNGLPYSTGTAAGAGAPLVYPARYQQHVYEADGALQWRTQSSDTAFTQTEYQELFAYNDARVLTDEYALGWGRNYDRWHIDYDRAGRPKAMTDPQNRSTSYTRNANGTLNTKALTLSGVAVDKWQYEYDGLDRVHKRTRTLGSGTPRTEVFHYDQVGRLDAVSGVDDTIAYDPNGNRTELKGKTTSYRADNSIAVADGKTFGYAPFGGVTTDGCATTSYDGHDRRTQTVTPAACPGGAGTATWLYDPLGRQIRSTDNGTGGDARTTRYLDATGTVIAEDSDSNGNRTARYTNTPDGQAIGVSDGLVSGTKKQTLHSDGQGNIVLATDALTAACAVYLDPWGQPDNPRSQTDPCTSGPAGTTTNSRWFQSTHRDGRTGTYQWGDRNYNPQTGTWLTPDTGSPGGAPSDLSIGTDPLTANRYNYVNGDPVNLTDPSGHEPCPRDGCTYENTSLDYYHAQRQAFEQLQWTSEWGCYCDYDNATNNGGGIHIPWKDFSFTFTGWQLHTGDVKGACGDEALGECARAFSFLQHRLNYGSDRPNLPLGAFPTGGFAMGMDAQNLAGLGEKVIPGVACFNAITQGDYTGGNAAVCALEVVGSVVAFGAGKIVAKLLKHADEGAELLEQGVKHADQGTDIAGAGARQVDQASPNPPAPNTPQGTSIVKYEPYPPAATSPGGFAGGPLRDTLRPGAIISRYGGEGGRYASPAGAPFSARALPPSHEALGESLYRVARPIDVDAGISAWWQGGGGVIQYRLPGSVTELLESGVLKRVDL